MNHLIFIILSVLFCTASIAENYTIKVGAIFPLSGDLAYVGRDIQEGITLALEDRGNTEPKIEVFWEDSKFSLKESVSAAQKLISQKKVDVILSLWDTADVIAPVTEQAKVIQLSIRWNPDVAAKHSYTFTFESTYKTFAKDMVALLNKMAVKRVAFINEETQGNILEADEFERLAPASGLELVGRESVVSGERDFKPVLTRLLAKNPEIVVTETWPPMTETIIKQLDTLRPGTKHSGYYEVIEDLSVIEGQPFVSQLGYTPVFAEKFKKRFGHSYRIRAPHAYELIRLIAYAFEGVSKEKKPTTAEARDHLSTLKDFDSVLGKLSVNGTRNIEHPNVFKVAKGGVLEKFE